MIVIVPRRFSNKNFKTEIQKKKTMAERNNIYKKSKMLFSNVISVELTYGGKCLIWCYMY